MRILDVVSTANKNLSRSKLRTFLTLLAIAIGTFTLALSLGLGQGVKNYISSQLGQYDDVNFYSVTKSGVADLDMGLGNGDPQEYKADSAIAGNSFEDALFTESDIQNLRNVTGVEPVRLPYTATFTYATADNGKKYVASNTIFVAQTVMNIVAGQTLSEDTDAGSILLSRKYISLLNAQTADDAVGKKIALTYKTFNGEEITETFTVKGVYEPTILDSAVTLNQPDSERIARLQAPNGQVQFYYIFATRSNDVTDTQFKEYLENAKFSASGLADINNTLNGVVTGVQVALGTFSGIAILAALVGVINTLFMAVLERTKEIGLLRAIGSSKKTIFALFSVEAMLLGVWGSAIGLTSAYLAQIAINSIAENTFLKGIEGLQLLAITPWMALIIIATVATITLLAGILPAIKASRLDPIEALRYE